MKGVSTSEKLCSTDARVPSTGRARSESGTVVVGVLIVMISIGGLAAMLLTRATASSNASASSAELTRLLFVAEAGLNYNYVKLAVDPKFAAKDTTEFSWNATTKEFEANPLSLQTEVTSKAQTFQISVQFLNLGVPVVFADRTDPQELVDEIIVRSRASSSRASRTVTAWYEFNPGYRIGGAIVSDMIPTGPVDFVEGAKDSGEIGHLGFEDENCNKTQFHVFGDILSNGTAVMSTAGGTVILTEANVDDYFAIYQGKLNAGLAGTAEEVPDLTSIASSKQLFDFDRIEAVAIAGGGEVFASVKAFEVRMKVANLTGNKLEGVIVIHIDIADGANNYDITQNVNITGTLMVRFADGTDPLDKIQMLNDCNINAANLASVNPLDETTYTSGYPGTYNDPSKKPSAVDISPTFLNFAVGEDLPAMMYNNAVLDIHGSVNICGVVYAASFLELENKNDGIHYINGAVFAGGGVFIQAGETSGAGSKTMIRFDVNTVDALKTLGDGSGSLERKGYAVSR